MNESTINFLYQQAVPKEIEDINFLQNDEKTKLIQLLQSNSVFKLYSVLFNLMDYRDLKKSYFNIFHYFTQIYTKERSYVATIVFLNKIDAVFHVYDCDSEQLLSEYSDEDSDSDDVDDDNNSNISAAFKR